jgi:hypothetical protein
MNSGQIITKFNQGMASAMDQHDRGRVQTHDAKTNCRKNSLKDQYEETLKADDHPKDENS